MDRINEIAGHAEYSEKSIERYLVKRVSELGGIALKYDNPNQTGFPDRIVLLPGGLIFWVELKSKGKYPRMIQLTRHAQLRALGFKVYVIDDKKLIDELLQSISTSEGLCENSRIDGVQEP